MNKILTIILLSIFIVMPMKAYAAFGVGWNATSTTQGWISPNLVNGVLQIPVANQFLASFFTATSTTVASTFAGLVGIGTTSPQQSLTVVSGGTAPAITSGTIAYFQTSGATIMTLVGGNTGTSRLYFGDSDLDRSGRIIYDHAVNAFTFSTNNVADRMVLDSAGDVGIGTTSPWGKLSVTNTGTDPSFVVEDSTSPDSTPFIIDASGSVGIGTTTPSQKLHVELTSGTAIAQFTNTNGTFRIENGASYNAIASYNSTLSAYRAVALEAGGSGQGIYLTTAGNVGIGTTSPTSLLHVARSGAGVAAIFRDYTDGGSTGQGLTVHVNEQADGTDEDNLLTLTSTGNSTGSIAFGTGSSERMRITAGGNVGIGTTTPSNLLDVYASNTNTTLATAGTPTISITNSNTTNNNFSSLAGSTINSVGASINTSRISFIHEDHQSASEDGEISFMTRQNGTIADKMRITNNGLVGIGTTTPASTLTLEAATPSVHIAGTVGGANVRMTDQRNGNQSDFRFAATNGTGGISDANTFYLINVKDDVNVLTVKASSIGIGTSTPSSRLQVFNTATSTVSVDSNSLTQGGCLELKDRSGVGYTYITAEDGVLTASTVSCK